jgi:hypothetical protein
MTPGQSLAERMVFALSKVRDIGELINPENPMRHNVRSLKQSAERILSDSAEQATGLAYQAEQLVKDFEKAQGAKS